jgi:DNA-binding XRE family transcriptional regulator
MYKYILPTPEDIIGARAYLKLSQGEFAKKAGIVKKTLFNIENRKYDPSHEMLEKVQKAFLSEGIVFQQSGGFLANQSLIRVLDDDDGIREFFFDVLQTAKDIGGEFLVYGMDEVEFYNIHQRLNVQEEYDAQMGCMNNVKYRVITTDRIKGQLIPPYAVSYATYKVMPDDQISSTVPFYIYSDKLAVFLKSMTKIVIIKDSELVEAYSRMFDTLWNSRYAKPVDIK